MSKSKKPANGAEARAAYPRLAAWWDASKRHGTIYARPDRSRSNMSGTVLLWTILDDGYAAPKPTLDVCWPWQDGDECAARVGFSLKRRAFYRGGCGYDRVNDVVSSLSYLFDGTERFPQSVDTLHAPE